MNNAVISTLGVSAFALGVAVVASTASGKPAPRHVNQLSSVYIVQNCNGSGPGSLREAAGLAIDGDTVDLSRLACHLIVLRNTEGGELAVHDITITGPGQKKLAISGNGETRIFNHTGRVPNVLTITGLTLENGDVSTSPAGQNNGGCILSNSKVSLKYSTITKCKAAAGGGAYGLPISLDHVLMSQNQATGSGGAIAGYADVAYSIISNNTAAGGGGVSGSGTIMNSTIANNTATQNGGGLYGLSGNSYTISRSTISGNVANGRGGGIYLVENLTWPGSYPAAFAMDDSTISGNRSGTGEGGAYVVASTSGFIDNSTIVNNISNKVGGGAAGVRIASFSAHINNTIVASNQSDDNLGVDLEFGSINLSVLNGSHNLILTGKYTNMPNAVHGCPGVYPLGNYGGSTKTHALSPTSPAIDMGGATTEVNDQRGAGFARIVGAAADIGSYERQRSGSGGSQGMNRNMFPVAPLPCLASVH